jgi:hypothetical protein
MIATWVSHGLTAGVHLVSPPPAHPAYPLAGTPVITVLWPLRQFGDRVLRLEDVGELAQVVLRQRDGQAVAPAPTPSAGATVPAAVI